MISRCYSASQLLVILSTIFFFLFIHLCLQDNREAFLYLEKLYNSVMALNARLRTFRQELNLKGQSHHCELLPGIESILEIIIDDFERTSAKVRSAAQMRPQSRPLMMNPSASATGGGGAGAAGGGGAGALRPALSPSPSISPTPTASLMPSPTPP